MNESMVVATESKMGGVGEELGCTVACTNIDGRGELKWSESIFRGRAMALRF